MRGINICASRAGGSSTPFHFRLNRHSPRSARCTLIRFAPRERAGVCQGNLAGMQEFLEAVWLEAAYQIFIQERGSMPSRKFWWHAVRNEINLRRRGDVYN